ncbi:hypothetical protein [Microbacterium sp.]|uniref:hypothetical protein n=1 Tax=Microbacterium sp. TaxID=51671 RepID=UPI0035AFD666
MALKALDAPGIPSAQITYRQEHKSPDQNAKAPVQISSPLGGIEGGEDNYRKPKSIPASRRLVLGNDRIFKNAKNRITNSDRINRFAIRVALDYLNRSYHFENKKMRSLEDVTSHVFTILVDKLKPEYGTERGIKGVTTLSMVERYSERAASFAVDVWRPDYFEVQARKGAKGGKKSKRKPEYTYADFLAVEGLTHPEAAAMLGVHVSSIRRMRQHFKKTAPIVGLDLLPPTELPPRLSNVDIDDLLKEL